MAPCHAGDMAYARVLAMYPEIAALDDPAFALELLTQNLRSGESGRAPRHESRAVGATPDVPDKSRSERNPPRGD
jgi:hypothetical protein